MPIEICGMKIIIHSHISAVHPLKVRDGQAISSHIPRIHAEIKVQADMTCCYVIHTRSVYDNTLLISFMLNVV